ncbi:MAG: hypothetical protein DUD27_00915 [Lachnospiraceae bacterium]|uniref:Com family DNA-binding transcriptional regulator n=1 Tax=Candidatus Weimeria bifida TaxID=2599074 RepID=A0A6N7J031_9FIRM|nr:hypothetical protein [Candidatus Weimeria bifida]RRF97152.1 MAG: hypothetical protein DUD27_00915 [Lachnospiraceae bacterium]
MWRIRAFFVELYRKIRYGRKNGYKIYNCPNCGQKIRVPRGHGKIEITCPKCGTKFIKRS